MKNFKYKKKSNQNCEDSNTNISNLDDQEDGGFFYSKRESEEEGRIWMERFSQNLALTCLSGKISHYSPSSSQTRLFSSFKQTSLYYFCNSAHSPPHSWNVFSLTSACRTPIRQNPSQSLISQIFPNRSSQHFVQKFSTFKHCTLLP